MIVKEKSSGKEYVVYDISYNNAGFPHFLIYKDGRWDRKSAKYFQPIDYMAKSESKDI